MSAEHDGREEEKEIHEARRERGGERVEKVRREGTEREVMERDCEQKRER